MSDKPIPEKPTASPAAAAPEAGTEAIRLLHSAVEVLSFYAKLSPGMRADSDGSLAKAWLDAHPTIPAAPSPRPPEPEGREVAEETKRLTKEEHAIMLDFIRSMAPGGVLAKLCGAPAPEGPPDPAPAASASASASAGLRETVEELADVVEEAADDIDPTDAKGLLEALQETAVALREALAMPARAASAGEGALRAQVARLDCVSHDRLETMLRASETAREADRVALNDARCRIAEMESRLAAVDEAYRARLSERNDAIAENQRLRKASETSAPEGPSKAVESGAALAPAQRETEKEQK